jgi:uncharacterized protein (TIGR02391 family)
LPVAKAFFKRKFLELMDWCERYNKTLHETSLLGSWWNEYYGTGSALSEEDRRTARVAIDEMIRDELIARTPERGSPEFLAFRPKGRETLKKGIDPEVCALRPAPLVTEEELLSRCIPLFEQELYEPSIREAFVLLERRIRERAGLDASDIGVELVDKAFGPRKAILEVPLCADDGERLGVHQLFRGAMGLLKNPLSHRSVPEFQDRRVAAEIIVFCDLLLNLLKSAVRK